MVRFTAACVATAAPFVAAGSTLSVSAAFLTTAAPLTAALAPVAAASFTAAPLLLFSDLRGTALPLIITVLTDYSVLTSLYSLHSSHYTILSLRMYVLVTLVLIH